MIEPTSAPRSKPLFSALTIITFLIASVALILNFVRVPQSGPSSTDSALADIKSSRTLNVGFEGYPPYAVQDPRDQSMSGYSVDMLSIIAEEAGWNVNWVKTSPNTKIADLKAGRFDVMVEPIFQTIPRAKEVSFTKPYAYFGYASAIVREGEDRFGSITDLNNDSISIVVRQGYTDETYAIDHFPLADIRSMKVEGIGQVFLEVISGNADVALADTSQVLSFHEEHSSQVDMLFVDPPPASVPAGFMLRQGDFALTNFMNTALDYLEFNGILDKLDDRYNVSARRPVIELQ